MTQKQLIDQFCEFRGKCTTDDVVALTYAYKSLQLDFVNKACEWLEKKACLYVWENCEQGEYGIHKTMLEDFRKAMKGGEE